MSTTFLIFQKRPKVNNHPIGPKSAQSGHPGSENDVNLATTPFPMPLITPPVTKMYFILEKRRRD
jgi:hypothetical protein